MNISRRSLLTGLSGAAATAAFGKLGAQLPAGSVARAGHAGFPRKDDFLIDEGYTYINAAYTHPIPKVALEAARVCGREAWVAARSAAGSSSRARIPRRSSLS